jgi:cytochrome P450
VTLIPPSQPRKHPQIPIELDPPAHTRYRSLVSTLFSRGRIAAMRAELEALATQLLEPLAARGGGDFIADYAVPMSLGALASFMNLPAGDQGKWFGWVERMFAGALSDPDDQRQAVKEIEAYLDGLIAERREAPRDDFIGMLLEAEIDGHGLTDEEVRGFGVLILIAGHETTSGAIGLSLLHLAQHPEQRAQLFGDPALIPSAVNELLRFLSPVQVFGRNAGRDLELHGQTIPAGDVIGLGYGAANHDPREFPQPDRCILDRRPNRHVAFGHGHHLCLGANLARLELAISFERFGELLPGFRLDPGHPHRWKPRGDVRGLGSLHLLAGD